MLAAITFDHYSINKKCKYKHILLYYWLLKSSLPFSFVNIFQQAVQFVLLQKLSILSNHQLLSS